MGIRPPLNNCEYKRRPFFFSIEKNILQYMSAVENIAFRIRLFMLHAKMLNETPNSFKSFNCCCVRDFGATLTSCVACLSYKHASFIKFAHVKVSIALGQNNSAFCVRSRASRGHLDH